MRISGTIVTPLSARRVGHTIGRHVALPAMRGVVTRVNVERIFLEGRLTTVAQAVVAHARRLVVLECNITDAFCCSIQSELT